MASIEIKTTVSFQDLLKGVEQLELNELEDFLGKVLKLRAKKLAPSLPAKEAQLLEIINKAIPASLSDQFIELDKKRNAETLTHKEHEELIEIVKKIESLNAERMEALAELANIRQVSLKDLMKQLDIPSIG
ncbi:MAG: STAS/SEC14 domain-containing protein [Bacteroidetes bacterium]|nr:STAS/SEC14 domain-containing protein [Bacteroidota bacterium]MCB0842494.1 STAS/SEC14 domain-containing protein [Bacteroidota bacterium]